MSGAVIRLEEHALDWLYALAHGVPPDQLRAEWAECDRAGAPAKARAYGWYWRHVTAGDPSLRPSGNQRALIRACALVDAARSGPAVQATAGEVQRAEEVTLDELAAQLGGVKVSPQSARGDAPGEPWGLCGDECGSTYAWMYMLAAVEMARCYRPASDVEWLAAALALKLRRWLAAFVAWRVTEAPVDMAAPTVICAPPSGLPDWPGETERRLDADGRSPDPCDPWHAGGRR